MYYFNLLYSLAQDYFTSLISNYLVIKSFSIGNTNYHVLHYPFGAKWYKMLIPFKKERILFDEILDEQGNNVYFQVMEFAGPSGHFLTRITPHDLGYKSLTFCPFFGESKMFKEHDIIEY